MLDSHKRNQTIFILIISLIIILIILTIYFIGKNKTKPIMPFKTEESNEINKNIDDIYNKYDKVEYKIGDNEEIYSMLFTIDIATDSIDHLIPKYVSYNYDKKNNRELSNSDLLEQFGYKEIDVELKIEERFNNWYNQEVLEGYVEGHECDYGCYLSFYRNIDNLYEIYSLFVEKDKLYVYIGFDVDSLISDKEFFDNLDYNPFVIEL